MPVPVPGEKAVAIADPGVPVLVLVAKSVGPAGVGAIAQNHVLLMGEPATPRVADRVFG